MYFAERFRTPLTIAFAFVATHNHFVLDRGGKVFNRTAPIIKLPPTATEDDHLALLAYLNSSTACFWMKQVFYPKATSNSDISVEKGKPEDNRYEFAGTGMEPLPLPPMPDSVRTTAIALARRASELAAERERLSARWHVHDVATASARFQSVDELGRKRDELLAELVQIQEKIDQLFYRAFELGPESIRIIEDPLYKRPWAGRRGVFGHAALELVDQVRKAVDEWIEEKAEQEGFRHGSSQTITLDWLAKLVHPYRVATTIAHPDPEALPRQALLNAKTVPYLAALRFTASGLDKHAEWQHTWELQRREDAGETIDKIPVPPKYAQTDYRSTTTWQLRGPLDVPKERFISYPGCESDQDKEPVYGWAGWDHEQRAKALATLYWNRKTEESWSRDRLTPMLAGLLELLPWLKQWHDSPSDDYAGDSPANYYAGFLDGECRTFGLTHEDLRAWRPPEKTRGKKTAAKAASAPKPIENTDENPEAAAKPEAKAGKKPRSKKTPTTGEAP